MLKFGEVRKGPRSQFIDLVSDTLDQTPDTCFICEAADQ
jgi:hypothetical protein